MLLLVKLQLGTPEQFIQRIRVAIRRGLILDWRVDAAGEFTYVGSLNGYKKATMVLKPYGVQGVVGAMRPGAKAKVNDVGLYYGRFMEMLFNSFNRSVAAVAVMKNNEAEHFFAKRKAA